MILDVSAQSPVPFPSGRGQPTDIVFGVPREAVTLKSSDCAGPRFDIPAAMLQAEAIRHA